MFKLQSSNCGTTHQESFKLSNWFLRQQNINHKSSLLVSFSDRLFEFNSLKFMNKTYEDKQKKTSKTFNNNKNATITRKRF